MRWRGALSITPSAPPSRGKVSDCLRVASPGNHPCVFRCSAGVCDAGASCLRYCMVWCKLCLVCPVVPLCFMTIGWAKCRNDPFGVPDILSFCEMLLRSGGGSHGGETLASLSTMVPQNDSPKGGAAHGPRHPSCSSFFWLGCCFR